MTAALAILTRPEPSIPLPSRSRQLPTSVALDCPLCLETVVVEEASYRSDTFACPVCAALVDWAPDDRPAGRDRAAGAPAIRRLVRHRHLLAS